MNKFVILYFISLLFLAIGCGGLKREYVTQEEHMTPVIIPDNPVTMTIVSHTYATVPETVDLKIENHTNLMVQFGADYRIERFSMERDRWEVVEFPAGIAFISIMYLLPANETGVYPISLYPQLIQYEPGSYQVVKQIFVEDESQEFSARFVLD